MTKKKDKKKIKKIKFELSLVSMVLWGAFLIFLLGWVFILGIFVGRGFLPESISNISVLNKQVQKPLKIDEQEKGDHKTSKEEPELYFYKKLASKKNEVKRNSISKKKKNISQEIKLFKDESYKRPVGHEASEIKNTIKKKQSPELPLEGTYSVQVASLSSQKTAAKLKKELVDQGYDAYYYAATVRGKTTYRIMCGRFSRHSSALEYLAKLKRDTGYKGFVKKVEQ